jgi:hypothetical protein
MPSRVIEAEVLFALVLRRRDLRAAKYLQGVARERDVGPTALDASAVTQSGDLAQSMSHLAKSPLLAYSARRQGGDVCQAAKSPITSWSLGNDLYDF